MVTNILWLSSLKAQTELFYVSDPTKSFYEFNYDKSIMLISDAIFKESVLAGNLLLTLGCSRSTTSLGGGGEKGRGKEEYGGLHGGGKKFVFLLIT